MFLYLSVFRLYVYLVLYYEWIKVYNFLLLWFTLTTVRVKLTSMCILCQNDAFCSVESCRMCHANLYYFKKGRKKCFILLFISLLDCLSVWIFYFLNISSVIFSGFVIIRNFVLFCPNCQIESKIFIFLIISFYLWNLLNMLIFFLFCPEQIIILFLMSKVWKYFLFIFRLFWFRD